MKKIFAVFIIISFLLSGCASVHNERTAYISGEDEYSVLTRLSDQQALEMVVFIYNLDPGSRDEETIRNLVLEDYVSILEKRKSALLKDSGVFELEYDKVEFENWDDTEILRMYDFIEMKLKETEYVNIGEATDTENTRRVIYLSARDILTYEGRRRDAVSRTLQIVGQILNIALTVLISII